MCPFCASTIVCLAQSITSPDCEKPVQSLCNHCAITVQSLCNHCAITVQCLRLTVQCKECFQCPTAHRLSKCHTVEMPAHKRLRTYTAWIMTVAREFKMNHDSCPRIQNECQHRCYCDLVYVQQYIGVCTWPVYLPRLEAHNGVFWHFHMHMF